MSSPRFFKVFGATAFASLLALGGSTTSYAQNLSLKAEIEAIKVELASLQELAATAPTLAQAVQELSSKLVVIEQQLAESGALRASMPAAIEKIDEMETQIGSLRTDLEYLRTGIANIEQPAVSGGGGIAREESGWRWSTSDGKSLELGGYFQPRYETQLPSDFATQDFSTFRARRARVLLQGKLDEKFGYVLSFELTSPTAPLRDLYTDMKYSEAFKVRIGQARVPFSKSFLAFSRDRDFVEFTELQERQRYDRDIGVWALGEVWDKRIHYHAGISNGAGVNSPNDNVDMVLAARVEGVVLGDYIAPGFGDYQSTEIPSLTLGLAAAHDLVRVGESVSGIEVGNRDVDGNGVLDNVRVLSSSIDAQFRYKGFEGFVEGTYRHERWGTILEHEDNADLSAAVHASDSGRRNYLGFSVQGSYFVLPHKLQAGARLSHGRLPLLGIGGQEFDTAPAAQRLLQTDAFVQFWREGYRRVGMTYSLLNFNEIDAPDPANDISHQFIVEAQLVL